MTKRWVFNCLRTGVSLGLLLFLLWMMRGSFQNVILAIKKINKPALFLSFIFAVFGILLLSARLRFIMRTQHLKIAPRDAVSLTFIGHFFNNFLPTSIGGDLIKAYYASRRTGKNLSSVACILFDRLLGTFTLILMVFFSYFFVEEAPGNKSVTAFLIIALTISLGVGLVLFSKRIAKRIHFVGWLLKKFNLKEKMQGLYEIIYNYKRHPKLILNAILLSIALQICAFYAVYLITRGLAFSIPLKTVFLFMPIISTISMAPSINGLGVREGSFVIFFGPLIGKEGAFALGILYLGLNFCISLIGGIIYLFSRQYHIKGGVKLT